MNTIGQNVRCHIYVGPMTNCTEVVNLRCIELATEEDKKYQIDYWAALFKARTWEELRMLVKDNEYLQEAAESMYVLNADEIARQHCIAREDAERRERTLERDKRLAEEALEKERKEKEVMAKEIERLKMLLARDEMNGKKFDEMMSVGFAQAKKGESLPAEEFFENID